MYTVSSFVHSFPKREYDNMIDYIADVLKYIYGNTKPIIHMDKSKDNEITCYVLRHLGNEEYDLDFVKVVQSDKPISKASKHDYMHCYLNINHNPVFLNAPKFMIEKMMSSKHRLTDNGMKWLTKMNEKLKKCQKRKEFKANLQADAELTLAVVGMAKEQINNRQVVSKVGVNSQVPNYLQSIVAKQKQGIPVMRGL